MNHSDQAIYTLLLWSTPILLAILGTVGMLAINWLKQISVSLDNINIKLERLIVKHDDLERRVEKLEQKVEKI